MANFIRNLLRLHFRPGNSMLAYGLRQWNSRYISQQTPIIIGGCPRSGTTLMRLILDVHPSIACGPESALLLGRFPKEMLAKKFEISADELAQLRNSATDHAHFIELFFKRYAAQQGKTRWADKTPGNIRHLAYVYHHFPNAKFVHVVRDGRDVACSLQTFPKYHLVDGQPIPTNIRRPLQDCVQRWLRDTAAGMAWRRHPNYLEVRYEDLVDHTEPTLRRLCAFLGELWHPELLDHHRRQSQRQNPLNFFASANAIQPISAKAVGRWRDELTVSELQTFYRLGARRLIELGYCIEPVADLNESLQYSANREVRQCR